MSDQNYLKALDKEKEFKTLYQQLEEKIKKMDAELASMRTSVSQAENVVKRKNEEIQMSESVLKKQAAEMDALKIKIVELEKVS